MTGRINRVPPLMVKKPEKPEELPGDTPETHPAPIDDGVPPGSTILPPVLFLLGFAACCVIGGR